MQIVGNKMPSHVEKVIMNFDILLPAFRAILSLHIGSTIKTICFTAISFLTHDYLKLNK